MKKFLKVKAEGYKPPEIMQRIINRANQLNGQDIERHHHLLSNNRTFNETPTGFTLVFEDYKRGIIKERSEERAYQRSKTD